MLSVTLLSHPISANGNWYIPSVVTASLMASYSAKISGAIEGSVSCGSSELQAKMVTLRIKKKRVVLMNFINLLTISGF